MSIAAIIARKHLGHAQPRMSPQMLANLMLQQDQERRSAIRSGNLARAAECEAELNKLEQQL